MSGRERGAAGVAATLFWAITTAVALVVLGAIADLAATALRAQAAADAAALAAAGATLLGPSPADPQAAADTAARLHGGALLSCCGQAEVIPPRIRVRVVMRPGSGAARLVRARVVREARASLRPANHVDGPSGFRPVLPNS